MKSSIFIPYLLRDGAILQRNQEYRFWGYTGSEQEVILSYEEIILKTKSDEKGYFDIILPAHEVSESIDFKSSPIALFHCPDVNSVLMLSKEGSCGASK